MKYIKKYIIIAMMAPAMLLTSCKDYLTEIEPGTTMLNDFFINADAAIQNVTSCYVPLMWEYGGTYFSEWFIGDIASDDAIKGGGSTSDMADAYDFENWRTTPQNTLLLSYYRAQYQGIGRCNMALQNIEQLKVGFVPEFTEELKNRLLGEAHFLRAYYYFRLVRIFGGVPNVTTVLKSSEDWGQPRASIAQTFNLILSDLAFAEANLPLKSKYPEADLGRATKGAAQAMLMKVNLYMGSKFWQKKGVNKSADDCFDEVIKYGKLLEESKQYTLCPNYEDNFTVLGENGPESVFEIQYAEVGWGDYGQGMGYTAGSFTQILVRSRSSLIGGGWGFNHPTQNLYDEFEAKDSLRRAVAILIPEDSLIETPAVEYYLGNKMLNNKYGMYRDTVAAIGGGFGKWDHHASRGALNSKQIRYADVRLMYAEAALARNNPGKAKDLINEVRTRAGLDSITVADDKALRHERRCELAMEGHRWFDLVRWEGVDGNGLKAHMDAYKATETEEAKSHIQEFVSGKHELFPIPQEEIQLNPTAFEQNPGY